MSTSYSSGGGNYINSSSTGVTSSPVINEDMDRPLWKFVIKSDKDGVGGNIPWVCTFCQMSKKTSYTRVRAHLLKLSGQGIVGCKGVKAHEFAEIQRLDAEAEKRSKGNAPKTVPLPPSSSSFGSSIGGSAFVQEGLVAKKRKGSGNPIEKAFNMGHRDHLHGEIARMFYSAGLPFNLARNPWYVSSYSYAANNPLTGYLPPGYNLLRTTLLQKERANIERCLEPIKGTWKTKGVSIVTDGWSDSQRRPLINFVAITEGGPMFLKAVDCSSETKTAHFIANLMEEVINVVGAENVVQIITENAANCRGAGQLIESSFPTIFWTPCVVHTLNLALKNICAAKNVENNQVVFYECSWINIVAADAIAIKNFIMNHSMRLAIFNEFVPLKLLSEADTRFASVLVMLKRFKLIKGGLQAMVISDKWSLYREDDVGKAGFVKGKLLDDIWWDSIDYILSFTTPIYDMLRLCDTDKPYLHLVYDMWDTMIERVKVAIYRHEGKRPEESSPFYDVVHQILVDRWNKNNTPLYCLAHALNPRYYSDAWLAEDPSRVAPHMDVEVSRERSKCLKKFFPSTDDRTKVNLEYADFSSCAGDFADFDSIHDRHTLDPKSWWVIHGACAPMLQRLAWRLLVQLSSSSCCKRNWSVYSFVHSAKRNKMVPQRAEDLVYIYSNLRLLSRKTPEYLKGKCKMWDIAGDTFDSLDDVGVLGVASLSLDEPDLETVLFTDNGDDGPDFEMVPNA